MGNTMTYAPSTRDMRCRPIDAAGVPNKEVIERLGRLYCEAADLPEDLQASLTSKWAESGNMVVPGSLRNLRPAQWT